MAYLARIEAETKREEEQDEPSTTYDRVRNAAIALCVLDCSLGASGILTDGIEGKMFQARCLIAPIATTGLHLLFFGTLDSSAMASVAVWTWRVYFFVLGALTFICPISVNYYRAAFYLIFYWFGAVYYWCWLLATARERMRTRFEGGLAARSQLYTSRLFQIASFQMALLVQGLTQGVGPKSFGRNLAILTFSVSMLVAWAFSTQVFDAGETDTRKPSAAAVVAPRERCAGGVGAVRADWPGGLRHGRAGRSGRDGRRATARRELHLRHPRRRLHRPPREGRQGKGRSPRARFDDHPAWR